MVQLSEASKQILVYRRGKPYSGIKNMHFLLSHLNWASCFECFMLLLVALYAEGLEESYTEWIPNSDLGTT